MYRSRLGQQTDRQRTIRLQLCPCLFLEVGFAFLGPTQYTDFFRNPERFVEPVDPVSPCWPLLLVRTAKILVFQEEKLEKNDFDDLDDIIGELKVGIFFQTAQYYNHICNRTLHC